MNQQSKMTLRNTNKKFYLIGLFVSILCFMLIASGLTIDAKVKRKAKSKGVPAYLSSLNLQINNISYYVNEVPGYVINNSSYYRLSDLAFLLQDTYSQFDIVWNPVLNRTELKKLTPYSKSQNKYNPYSPGFLSIHWVSAPIAVGENVKDIQGFLHQGEFYVPLRDITEMLGVKTKWLPESMSILLIPEFANGVRPLTPEKPSLADSEVFYNEVWASPKPHYLYYDKGYYFSVYPSSGLQDRFPFKVDIEKLSPDMKIIDTISLPYRGTELGGFYHGEKYNYFLFGTGNHKEQPDVPVLTLLKTDHDFKELATVNVSDVYTTIPFSGGTVSMSEYGNTLVIHTSRQRYLTPDGLKHQSQLTVAIDTDTMQIINPNGLGKFQENHVSHSFNQMALHDDSGNLYLIDHGDAFPRSILLTKMDTKATKTKEEVDILKIPGEIGANQTGVFVGGIEQNQNSLFLALNRIDYSKADSFEHHVINGSNVKQRDVFLYIINKNNPAKNIKEVKLTNYLAENDTTYSVPKILKLNDNRFFVLWEKKTKKPTGEFSREYKKAVQYVIVNEQGEVIQPVTSLPWHRLSEGNLIYQDGKVIWQVRDFYDPEKVEAATMYWVEVR